MRLAPNGSNGGLKVVRPPLGGPAQVLEYLSRYTHRTAIGNERIRAVNDYGWWDDRQN